MPFNIGPGELIVILIVALLLFGPKKLPDLGKAMGESIGAFKKALNGSANDSPKSEEAQPQVAQPQVAQAQTAQAQAAQAQAAQAQAAQAQTEATQASAKDGEK